MQPKELHDFLFKLFDFADAMTDPAVVRPADYKVGLMIMAYIEDIMDVYGRSLIHQAAQDAGIDAQVSLSDAHARLDRLRAGLGVFEDNPELRTTIDEAADRLRRNYGTR